MKLENLCWLENWQVRYPYPKIAYGARCDAVIATFLAITERKNCELLKQYQEEVAIVGNVFNYPTGEFEDGAPIMARGVVKIEHRLLIDNDFKARPHTGWKSVLNKFSIDHQEKHFATLVTAADEVPLMLGFVGERLKSSADSLNWEMLKGAVGYSHYPHEDDQKLHFENFADYFCNVNENYCSLGLE